MSIPACDYDTILASQPTTWQDLDLHWHCYAWRGDGKTMQADETARNDPNSDALPLRIRDWLIKPARLLRAAPLTPEDAAAWLRQEYEPLVPQIAGDIGEAIAIGDLMAQKVYDLRCGGDPIIVRWLRGGQLVHLAVLSLSRRECDRH